jgi:hypothetical protein
MARFLRLVASFRLGVRGWARNFRFDRISKKVAEHHFQRFDGGQRREGCARARWLGCVTKGRKPCPEFCVKGKMQQNFQIENILAIKYQKDVL